MIDGRRHVGQGLAPPGKAKLGVGSDEKCAPGVEALVLERLENGVGPHGAGEKHPPSRVDVEPIADRDDVIAEPGD